MNPGSKEQKDKSSPLQEIQEIANNIKSDVEKQLKKAFDRFRVLSHEPLESKNPEGSSYALNVQTDDKDKSNLKLRTWRRSPYSPWETMIDEFFSPISPFDNFLLPFDSSTAGFDSIQSLADSIRKDVERDLNMSFPRFDVTESHPILTDPEHTSYYMKVKTDDNGHVRVKTIKKVPGSDWQTHVEEFNRGKALEGKKPEALEGKGKGEKMETEDKQAQSKPIKGQKMETEKEGRRDQGASIQEEPYKAGTKQPSA